MLQILCQKQIPSHNIHFAQYFSQLKNHCTQRSKIGSKDLAIFCQLFLLFWAVIEI